jgi:peptidoglycan/LPS O-acetylase OafA/YrhL
MARRPQAPTHAQPRLQQLDVLRGVAVALVLGRHMGARPLNVPFAIQSMFDVWARVGWVGVDLFFVLSGFLVSGLLFHEYGRSGEVRVGRFLARRGLRIYPAFYVFLIVTSIASGTIGTRRFVAESAFVQNYFPGLWDHTWSLAIEEHFYFLLAFAVVILVQRGRRSSPAGSETAERSRDPFAVLLSVFGAVAAIELLLRIATARYGKASFVHHLYPTHLRLDSLLFGVLLSYLAWSRGDRFAAQIRAFRSPLMLLSIICLAPPFFLPATDPLMETVGFSLLYVGFGVVLVLAVYGQAIGTSGALSRVDDADVPVPLVRQQRAVRALAALCRRTLASGLAWIGMYSYSIYLWHLAVKRWGVPFISHLFGWPADTLAAFLAYVAGSLIVGFAMARAIEVPTLALRDRWMPTGARTLASEEAAGTHAPPMPLARSA